MFGSLDPTVALSLGLGLVAALAFAVIASVVTNGPSSRRYKRRLRAVTARKQGMTTTADPATTRSLSRRDRSTAMDRLAQRWLPHREVLVRRLQRTGRTIGVGKYIMVSFGLAVAVATLCSFLLVNIGVLGAILIGVFVGIALPHFFIGRLGKKRVARFLTLFPEAIDLMVRALRSGLPISEALINCAHEIGDPIASEFGSIESGMRLGRDLDTLLWDISKRIDTSEYKFFIIALAVQRETGGNLAETLANLADVLRRRRTMRQKARAMASEARATASILGSLPILVSVILMVTSPNYIMPLFTDPRGMVLLAVAVGMLVTGISIMVKLARFDI